MRVEGLFQRAAQLIDLGRLAEAEQLARELLGAGHHEPRVFVVLSMSLRLQARYEEAEAAARAAVSEDLANSFAHAELSRVLLALGRDVQAVGEAREAVRLNSYSTNALHALVEAAMHVSLPEAEAAAAAIQRIEPHSSLGHSLRASVEMARKRWPEAEHWLRESLRANPLSASSHVNLAIVLDYLGRREEARAEHQEAVRLDPQRAAARLNLHTAMRMDRVKGEAGASPYSADLVGSTLAPAVRARSLTLLMQQSLRAGGLAEAQAAAAECREVLAEMPLTGLEERRSRVLALASIARVEHPDDPVAEAAMVAPLQEEARAVLAAKDLFVFLNNLGAALLRGGSSEAVSAFESVVEVTRATGNPNTIGMALLNLGAAYGSNLQDGQAEPCYLECLQLSTANGHHARAARACINLAQVYLRRDDVRGGRKFVEQALGWLEGQDEPVLLAKVMVTAGQVELREGSLEAARRTLLKAVHGLQRGGEATEVDGFAYLAEIAGRTGRPRLAALHLSRAEARARSPQTRETVRRVHAVLDSLPKG